MSEKLRGGAAAVSAATLRRFALRARAAAGVNGTVTVLLNSASEMRGLNRRFRGKNRVTDVLSFPAPGNNGHAGDIAVCLPQAQKQAREHGHSVSEEIKILLLHGMLHLAGMDHERDNGSMRRKEERLRRELGLAVGLISRSRQKSR